MANTKNPIQNPALVMLLKYIIYTVYFRNKGKKSLYVKKLMTQHGLRKSERTYNRIFNEGLTQKFNIKDEDLDELTKLISDMGYISWKNFKKKETNRNAKGRKIIKKVEGSNFQQNKEEIIQFVDERLKIILPEEFLKEYETINFINKDKKFPEHSVVIPTKPNNDPQQNNLNKKIQWVKGLGQYTDYHSDRANVGVYQTSKNLLKLSHGVLRVNDSKEWEYLRRRMLAKKDDPNFTEFRLAGGWYLIYEQQKFLYEAFLNIFNEFSNEQNVDICEAGVASFVHHYTYVAIILKALKASRKNLKINLTVIDKFPYPLRQIEMVHKFITTNEVFERREKINKFVPDFTIRKDFVDFIKKDFDTALYLSSIDVNCKALDLTDPMENPKLKFDIITEHYLIHITNQSTTNYFSWLKAIRENYKEFSKKKLYLIMAVGHRNEEYFAWHQHLGFKLIEKEKVWDLYDEDLFSIQNTKIDSIEIHKINNFLIWKYEKPQRDIQV